MGETYGKRNAKDSVFCDLFDDPEYQLKLYRVLHPEDTEVTIDDFSTVTIINVLTNQPYNDLGFTVRDQLLLLVEAQSTWSINIIIRILMYLGQTIKDYIVKNEKDMYGSRKIDIPRPEFYVIYTGNEKNVSDVYSLADEFFEGDRSFIDLEVRVLKADEEKHDIVREYISYTKVLDEQIRKWGRTEKAVRETIRICKDRDILKEYLKNREMEVISIMSLIFTQEEATRMYGISMKKEGKAEGRVEGRITGALEVCRDMNMTDRQIEDYLMKKFNISQQEVAKYLN